MVVQPKTIRRYEIECEYQAQPEGIRLPAPVNGINHSQTSGLYRMKNEYRKFVETLMKNCFLEIKSKNFVYQRNPTLINFIKPDL
jgi:hypothetical protein